jgi:hypothetical protein
MIDIEYTDRYGGHAPSWLRACHDDCEATGHVPVEGPSESGPGYAAWMGAEVIASRYRAAWREAHSAAITGDPMHEATCDGWHFVICPACHGNGTVSRWRSLARVPRWIWRGARILVVNEHMRAPWTSLRAWWWLKIKTAYLYDLGWPNRP